jgi:hypothetical protein
VALLKQSNRRVKRFAFGVTVLALNWQSFQAADNWSEPVAGFRPGFDVSDVGESGNCNEVAQKVLETVKTHGL